MSGVYVRVQICLVLRFFAELASSLGSILGCHVVIQFKKVLLKKPTNVNALFYCDYRW